MRSLISLAIFGLVSLASAVPTPQRAKCAILSELVVFNASTTYLADQSVINPGLKKLAKCRGFKYAYHGIQAEDGRIATLVIGWDKNRHHGETREECVSGNEAVKPVTAPGGTIDIQHILFSVDLTSVLTAPFTEFVSALVKEEKTEEAYITFIESLLIPAIDDSAGSHPPSAWGKSKEKNRTFVTTVGWDSIEAHEKAVSVPPFTDKIFPQFLELASPTVAHYRLRKY